MTFWGGIFVTCVYVYLCLDRARENIFGKANNSSEFPDSSEKQSLNTSTEPVGNRSCEDLRCRETCNGICYNSKINICVNNRLDCSCLARCNKECYNPKKWDCVENKLCPIRQILCHVNANESYCYDPSRTFPSCACPVENNSTHKGYCHLQSLGELDCLYDGGLYCGNTCYDITESTGVVCSEDGNALCGDGTSYCKNDCYSPESGAKCYGGHTMCQPGEDYCDRRCYVPESGAICHDGHTLCQKHESICGYQCYDPTSRAICYKDHTLCQKNESICGYKCYDQNSGDTCQDGVLCHKDEAKCGNSCYNPIIENCVDNSVACRKRMQLCGYSCMWPHNETCHDMSDNMRVYPKPCPNSEKLCDYKCYNPDESTCWNGNLCPLGLKSTGGKKCVKGIICNQNEEACNGRCYDPARTSKHVRCTKRFNTRGWLVWYENNMRVDQEQTALTVSDSDEFTCDQGFEENMNGECQRVFKLKEIRSESYGEEVEGGEDYS